MEFTEILKRRRMVRHYTGEPVPRESVRRIVQTVRRAPSAGFSQGQRLLVVDDPGLLKEISPPDEPGAEPWFGTSTVHIFVLTREQDYHDRYTRDDKLQEGEEIAWTVPFWHVDAGAALMLVLLAAIDEGLAAGVYGIGDQQQKLRDVLGIPEDVVAVAGVTIGWPLPDPEWSKRTSRTTQRRRELDEFVSWNRWAAKGD